MKLLITGLAFFVLAASPRSCQRSGSTECFKGRLEIKGICSNYTIKVLEGAAGDAVQSSWTDEQTGKTYSNVFRLANPCAFPENIKEGDTFYFSIDTAKQEQCNVCMAYYPTPEKALSIKVLSQPCK